MNQQSTNPKDLVGKSKPPMELVPPVGMILAALAMRDGAGRYGPYNWREHSVDSGTYIGAAMRHLAAWQDGEEMASDSGVSHLGHAIAGLCILADAQAAGMMIDNRPPKGSAGRIIAENTLKAPSAASAEVEITSPATPSGWREFKPSPYAAAERSIIDRQSREDFRNLANLGASPRVAREIALGISNRWDIPRSEVRRIAYVAGPMRGIADFNFPAFDAARDEAMRAGFDVISPADIDRVAGDENSGDQARFCLRDFYAIYYIATHFEKRGALIVLPGWESSTGAVAEFMLARWLGLAILDSRTMQPLDFRAVNGVALIGSVRTFLLTQSHDPAAAMIASGA